MGSYLRLFTSVRFNIFLFVVIAGASAIGTLLPQAPETPEKVEQWMHAHPAWGRLFEGLGFFHLYESWWYLALLALMAFNIVACKLASAPPDPGLVRLPPELEPEQAGAEIERVEAALAKKPLHGEFLAAGGAEEAAGRVRAALAFAGYHLHVSARAAADGRASMIATKHRPQRWGSYISHVALVVILVGGLLKQLYGFVEMVPVLDGGTRAMQYKPRWELRVDDFTIKYYEGTRTPSLFSSDLKVYEGDTLLARKVIKVNDPLDIGGVRFYQASWGAGGMFRSVTMRFGKHVLQIPQRTPTKIPGSRIRVSADVMLPNFTIGPDARADSSTLDLKNPAVKVRFAIDGHPTRPLWLLQNSPGVAFAEDEDGTLAHAPPPPFGLLEIDPVLFSGIQVAYDPGYPVVLTGAVAWLVGMILLFWLHRRRLWIVIGPGEEPGGVRVRVGAWSSRGTREFQKEFESLVRRVASEAGGTTVQLQAEPVPA